MARGPAGRAVASPPDVAASPPYVTVRGGADCLTDVAGQADVAPPPVPRSLRQSLMAVAVLAFVAAALGIGVRALETAHVAVDEEQYVLSAISLAEDGDLDITDELGEQRWRAFADVAPQIETSVLLDGTQISPHDPLLPLLLAVPAGVAGWVGAKVALSLVAGALAALTLWLAVRRFGVRVRTAVVGVGIAGASMPLAVYGQQIYPELPAALVTLLGVVALTGRSPATVTSSSPPPPPPAWPPPPPDGAPEPPGPRTRPREGADGTAGLRRWELALLGVAVTVLPWLSVKYALVAVALAALGAQRAWYAGQRREIGVFAVALVLMSAAYLAVHRAVWGGWTAYASGDHFSRTGEFAVVGVDPNYLERALRLIGLLLDREFGLVPWQPAWLLLVPAVAALLAARNAAGSRIGTARTSGAGMGTAPTGTGTARTGEAGISTVRAAGPGVLLWPLAAGWFVATFVALTMHGYWSPGRQVVVVLPLGVLAILVWLDGAGPMARRIAVGLGLAGVVGYAVLLVQGYLRLTTWVVHFVDADSPVYRLLGPVLTHWRYDYRWPHLIGLATVVALAAWGVRSGSPDP